MKSEKKTRKLGLLYGSPAERALGFDLEPFENAVRMKSVIARELNDFGIEGNVIQTNGTTFTLGRRTAGFEVIGPVYRLKISINLLQRIAK